MPLAIRCFGKGEEAEALIRQRDGPGIVEDEVKAYLLCIDCEELLTGTASRGVLRHIAAKSVIPAELRAILVHNLLPAWNWVCDRMRFAGRSG